MQVGKPMSYLIKCLVGKSRLLDDNRLLELADEQDVVQRRKNRYKDIPYMRFPEIDTGQIFVHGDSVVEVEVKLLGQRVVKYTPYEDYRKTVTIKYSIDGKEIGTCVDVPYDGDKLVRQEFLFGFDKNIRVTDPELLELEDASSPVRSEVKKLKTI